MLGPFLFIDCYSKAFEHICAECGQYILDDKYIETLGQTYHCVFMWHVCDDV